MKIYLINVYYKVYADWLSKFFEVPSNFVVRDSRAYIEVEARRYFWYALKVIEEIDVKMLSKRFDINRDTIHNYIERINNRNDKDTKKVIQYLYNISIEIEKSIVNSSIIDIPIPNWKPNVFYKYDGDYGNN